MKQIQILMFCLITACLQAQGEMMDKTISYSSYNLYVDTLASDSETYSVVSYGDLLSKASMGAPTLPRHFISVALPPNVKGITASVYDSIDGGVKKLKYRIVPGTNPVPTDYSEQIEFVCDELEYQKDNYSSEPLVRVLGVEDYYGINTIVSIMLTPVQYNPHLNMVKRYNSISFIISYSSPSDNESTVTEGSHLWRKMNAHERRAAYEDLKMSVFNPEDLCEADYTAPQMTAFYTRPEPVDTLGGLRVYEYSIITNRALGQAFERLASLKRQTGLDAGIIYIEDILSNPLVQNGDTISNINDDAGKLRQFLLYGARETNLKYVLLGGKRPIIPIRYATIGRDYEATKEKDDAFEYNEVPSDWYYSNYIRNWNVDGDQFYGELKESMEEVEENLYAAYLYVGRIPCTTETEVNNYIDKLEFYTLNPGQGNPDYLIAAYSHFSDSALRFDTEKASDGEFVACSPIGQSFSDHVIYRQTEMKSGQAIVQSWVDKKFGLLDFHCHSNPFQFTVSDVRDKDWPLRTVCAVDSVGKWGPEEERNGLDNMDNFGYPNVIYSMSCVAAPFDAPEYCGYGSLYKGYGDVPCTLAESFLLGKNYGGVAFIGNSRKGWFVDSSRLEANFFRNFWQGGINAEIGRMFNRSQLMLNSSEIDVPRSFGYSTRVTRNLMGDPQLMIWRGIPKTITGVNVSRNDVNIQVSCHGDNGEANYNLEGVVVEPDGKVHREFLGQLYNFKGLSPNSSVSVISSMTGKCLPYICDLKLQNIEFEKQYSYVYARKADVGENVINSRFSEKGPVKIGFRCTYVLDASDDVTLNKGTIISPTAKLKVYTPGTCTIDSVLIKRFGTLEIHASRLVINGKYTSDPSLPYYEPYGTLLAFGYDKYRRGDEAPIEIVDNTKKRIKARNNDYIPMLELGKEWRYTVHDCRSFTDTKQPDYEVKYRVDGVAEVDGKEYFVINEYDCCPWKGERMQPYCFMREDIEEKSVYLRANPDFSGHIGFAENSMICDKNEEIKIYDFSDYNDQEMFRRSIYRGGEFVAAEIDANDGIHQGYMSTSYRQFGCFEGLGLVQRPEIVSGMYYGDICDLTGFYPIATGGGEISPFLYAVVAPDGTEIFSNDKHRPGACLESVSADGSADGEAEYFNLQGMRIHNPVEGTICIRRQGATVTKVLIR